MRRRKSHPPEYLEVARQRVVAAFADHWRKIARSRRDISKERAHFFFAGSTSVEHRLARSFYGREHARQMASLSAMAIRETLSPWLEHAVRYWADEQSDSGGSGLPPDDFLAQLPTAEYVSIIHGRNSCPRGPRYRAFRHFFRIDRYPGERVGYDDLFERMCAGYSIGATLRIYKSTGEPFTPFEARSACAGIRFDILEGMAMTGDDEWTLNIGLGECRYSEGFDGEDDRFDGEDVSRVVFAEAQRYQADAED